MGSTSVWQPVTADESSCFAYSTSGTSSESAWLKDPTDLNQKYDLISFLATAQKLRVGFSNITWQPALQAIGHGGTAEIRESLIGVQTSLAFKRVRLPLHSALEESSIFRSLVAEILVLMHPSIFEHPNIIRLECIGWDISLEQEKVWPVLVFEKSRYGDLNWFADFGAGIGIVHGDIKPQNVLVFEDPPGNYTAKLLDFGYSTVFAGQNSLIFIPRSWPWNAPEYHHRGFKITDAGMMDVFSLGLLCLWLVHRERLSRELPTDWNDLGCDRCSTLCARPCKEHQLQNLNKLKSEDNLVTFSTRATVLLDLSEKRKNGLIRFFESTLAKKPDIRKGNLEFLSGCLVADGARSPCKIDFVQGEFYDFCDELQIPPLLPQFLAVNYRVRRYIVACLSRRMSTVTRNPRIQASSLSIGFQLAICYHTGFGVSQDLAKSQALLKQSGKSQKDLKDALDVIRNYQRQSTRTINIQGYIKKGFLLSDLAEHYREHHQLDDAILEYNREIATMASVFGQEHGVVLMLKSFLARLYYSTGSFEKSKELETQCVRVLSNELGLEHEETLDHMKLLANILSKQGQWKEAEEVDTKVLETEKEVLGCDHLVTTTSMANLASTFCNRGRWEDAEVLLLQVQTIRTRLLGLEHPQTLNCLRDLAKIYINQSRLKEALELNLQVVATTTKILGPDHYHTLLSMGNLSATHYALGQLKEAEQLDLRVLEKRQILLGQAHPDTLESMANLAAVYQCQGRYPEAEDLNLQGLKASHLGSEHPHTLLMLGNLAYVYLKLGRWTESERLGLQVIEKERRILGDSHHQTLTSMNNLAMTYQSQQRWKDAECLQLQILQATQMSRDDPLMLTYMSNLAGTYRSLERWNESVAIHREVLERRKGLLGPEHPEMLSSMNNLAVHFYHQQGCERDAEEILSQVLAIEKRVLGTEHPDIIISMQNLGSVLRKQGKYQEAEQIHRQQLALCNKLLGREHPGTISGMLFLAETLRIQRKYEEAKRLAQEATVLSETVHGEGNIHTLNCMDFQTVILSQQGTQ